MSTFTVKLKVWNPAEPDRFAELEAWADTGAAYSWIKRTRLDPLGVQKVRRLQFRTIEGHTIERDLAAVFLSADGYTGGDNVVIAESGDLEVLGAQSLESLGLAVDPVHKKLIPLVVALGLSAVSALVSGDFKAEKE
jgi:predicted aspartyl protease